MFHNKAVPTQITIASNLRNLATTYIHTSTPVEPQEVAAVLRQFAEVLEKAALYA